jgi:subtilisin family serine protease
MGIQVMRWRRRWTTAIVATAALAAGAASAQAETYVVQTSPAKHAGAAVRDAAERDGARIEHTYRAALDGFSATMTPAQAAALRRDPRVRAVTPDAPTRAATVQADPPWGLDRIDQRTLPFDAGYGYDTTGAGVTVFVVDTGMRFTHAEFGGRASSGRDFVDDDADASDCHGHGTHVGGTTGGRTYGVAKGVRFVSLRVWSCDGYGDFSDMVAAVDWAVAHKPSGPAVINISGGGGGYEPMDEAVAAASAAGLTVVVAAMNSGDDACAYSPARAPSAVTVGAVDDTATRAWFSSYGSCVDVWAPGVDVLSAVNTSDTAAEAWSGTSMATPHVTGGVARFLQTHPTATPAQATAELRRIATPDAVTDARSPVTSLLYLPRDFTPPAVSAVTPAGGATGVPVDANVTATFSEAMQQVPTAAAFRLARTSDQAAVAGTGSWSGTRLTFDPAAALAPGTSYTASISAAGARDAAGNLLTSTRTWTFTTAGSGAPPNLVANPSFEADTAGWGPVSGTLARVALSGAPDGAAVAAVTRTTGTTYGLGTQPPTIASTVAGKTYVASVHVRGSGGAAGKPVQVTLRERTPSGALVRDTTTTAALSGTFARVGVAATAAASGNTLALRVLQTGATAGNVLQIDLAVVRRAGPAFGSTTAGSAWTALAPDAKRASRFGFSTPATLDVAHLQAFLDGRAAGSGSQPVRGLLYADSGGAPGALVARTLDVTIAGGRASGWVPLRFATPVRLAPGSYWLGLQAGGTRAVARFAATAATGGLRRNADPFADGASSPFGSATTEALRIPINAVGA